MISKTINVDVEVPDGEFCNRCTFITNIINLYSEPKCILFNKKLKYVYLDKYEKCIECIGLCNEDEDEE